MLFGMPKLNQQLCIFRQLVVIGALQKKGLSQRFEKRWDSPKKRWDRVKIPIRRFFPSASDRRFLNVGIGSCGPVPALSNPVPAFLKALGQPL